MRKVFLLTAVCWMLGLAATAQQADDIVGTYTVQSPFNDDVARIQINRTTAGTYQGRVVWANNRTNADGSVRTDVKNPDKKLRSRRYNEVIMVWNLTYDKDKGEWVDGKLYDPYSGKTFSVKFAPRKDSRNLTARYYKGIPALGIDAEWVYFK